MKKIYRGECEELYGQELEYPDHKCSDHLRLKKLDYCETHGLEAGPFERWSEEWYECSICHERFEDLTEAE